MISRQETNSPIIPVQPTSMDILCGRGRAFAGHPGNKNFAQIIEANLQRYKDTTKRIDRSILLGGIVDRIMDTGVRFVKQDKATKNWFELPIEQCHEKVGHALRDLMRKTQYTNYHNNQSRATVAMNNFAQNDHVLHEMNLNRFLFHQMRAPFSEIAGNDRESIRSLNEEQPDASRSSSLIRLVEEALFDDSNDLDIHDSLSQIRFSASELDSLLFHSSSNLLSDRPDLTQEPSFRNFDF